MYGTIEVIVADIQRPLISEGALTNPPHNLTIYKEKNIAWIIDPDNTQYTGHLGLLHKMIVGITESRLSQSRRRSKPSKDSSLR